MCTKHATNVFNFWIGPLTDFDKDTCHLVICVDKTCADISFNETTFDLNIFGSLMKPIKYVI